MSKAKFIAVVESLFQIHPVDADVREYFEKTIKAKRVNSKDVEKAKTIKTAILNLLQTTQKPMDRTQIGKALYDAGEFNEEFLLNEKGEIAYNSITAYANQLVAENVINKDEVKNGKVKRVVYSA